MLKQTLALFAAIGLASCTNLEIRPIDESVEIEAIAFGSCVREQNEAPIWNKISEEKPDVFLFLGDNIYGDTEDMSVMRAKYAKLLENKNLRKLLSKTQIMAAWDDHDYGENDGGVNYPMRNESREVFLETFYLNSPLADQIREHEGNYHSSVTGAPGRRIQFIVLDTRSFRSDLVKLPESAPSSMGRYMPNYDESASVLGSEQWSWLEGELRKEAQLRIVITSIQAIPDNHGWEKWGNLPLERERLFSLIESTNAKGVVLLSGDRHLSEISMLPQDDPRGIGYPLYEITASSLNQPSGSKIVEPNQFRISEENFRQENYGMINIDWSKSDPLVSMSIRNIDGEEVISETVSLGSLR